MAILLLSTTGGCVAFDTDQPRPVAGKARPYSAKATTYRVEVGDTLHSIARDFGVSPEAILAVNRFDDPDMLRPGQRILVPRPVGRAVTRERRVQLADGTPRAVAPRPVTGRGAAEAPEAPGLDPRLEGARYYAFDGPRAKPGRAEAAVAAADDDLASVPDAGGAHAGNFLWPVRGRIVAGFGANASGQHNDGINILAEAKSPVKAAEDGVVIYAGNHIQAYGNLLLIRHPSGYVTAYAHNAELLVEKSDKVRRGQKIATVGSSGRVSVPQLHFEVRRGEKPVDPLRYLVTATASR